MALNSEEAEVSQFRAKYSESDGGLENVVPYPKNAKVEQTLCPLKPDNFRFSARPGNINTCFHGPPTSSPSRFTI